MKLRPHQELAIQMCRESFARGNKRIMLAAPCSFGKTITAITMLVNAASRGRRAMFVCDRIKLVEQTIEACERYGIDVGVMQGQDHYMTDHTKQIQIASVHTLMRRRRMPDVDFMVIDEAHVLYQCLKDYMEKCSAVPVVGLSATPFSKGLGKYFQDLIVPITPEQLLDQGYLSPIRYYGGKTADVSKIRKRAIGTGGSDFHPDDLAGAYEDNDELTGDIIKNWMTYAENRQTVAFSPSIKHSKYLVEEFRKAGIEAEHIDGYMDSDLREILMEAHDAGEFKVLSCSRLLNTGWDSPTTSCIIDCFPTRSQIVWVQRVGRGMRTAEGKQDCLYLDHSGNTQRLGFAEQIIPSSLDDGEKRFDETNQVREKKKSEPKPCPACHQMMVGPKCVCGYERPMSERIKTSDEMLVEIKEAKKANRELSAQQKAAFLGELQLYAKTRGYSDGWAAHTYRAKTGVWPNKVTAQPATEVSKETMGFIRHKMIKYNKGKQKA